MDNVTKEVLLELLESSSEDDEFIFDEFFQSRICYDDSSEDEDEDEELEEEPSKPGDFMDVLDQYNNTDFKTNVKFNRSTVEQLIREYSHTAAFLKLQKGGKRKMGERREVYLYLWYLGNTITFSELATLFGIVKSSAWNGVRRVTTWLCSLGGKYIRWPQGDRVAENCRKFEAKQKLAGVIGAIGCTHITIAPPKYNARRYCRGKKNYTIVLQAVVDAEMKFTDIYCGEPGSMRDGKVLERSTLCKKAQSNYDELFPCNTFLLGSSAYVATNWLVPPFKDNGRLTDRQKSFNSLHSATWKVIEDAFELLKGRFRRLNNFTEQRNIDSIRKIVLSACILQNLCIINNDHYSLSTEEKTPFLPTEHNTDSGSGLHLNPRQTLFDYLGKQNII